MEPWQCSVCGYIYDPEKGDPDNGVDPGTPFEKLVKEDLTLITDMALGVIAFSIGGSLALRKLKRLGKHILWITPIEALAAFLITTPLIASVFPLIVS